MASAEPTTEEGTLVSNRIRMSGVWTYVELREEVAVETGVCIKKQLIQFERCFFQLEMLDIQQIFTL